MSVLRRKASHGLRPVNQLTAKEHTQTELYHVRKGALSK